MRELSDPAELSRIPDLEVEVWGSGDPVPTHMLVVIARTGGVVLVAHPPADPDLWYGFAIAMLARDEEGLVLHSHEVGTRAPYRSLGVGRRLKEAEWAWAQAHDLPRIEWTFDPLQSRNAWFNIRRLGARVKAYYPDYYGRLGDLLSRERPSDRLLMVWRGEDPAPEPEDVARAIEIPGSILELEDRDAAAAVREVERVRAEFLDAFADGLSVVGFRRDGPAYLLGRAEASGKGRPRNGGHDGDYD